MRDSVAEYAVIFIREAFAHRLQTDLIVSADIFLVITNFLDNSLFY